MSKTPPNNSNTKKSADLRQALSDVSSGITSTHFSKHQQALVYKACSIALGGDRPMLRFLLERQFPKDRCVDIKFPRMEFANDAIDAIGAVLAAVAGSKISPREAADLASVIVRAVEVTELKDEVDAIKQKLGEPMTPPPQSRRSRS